MVVIAGIDWRVGWFGLIFVILTSLIDRLGVAVGVGYLRVLLIGIGVVVLECFVWLICLWNVCFFEICDLFVCVGFNGLYVCLWFGCDFGVVCLDLLVLRFGLCVCLRVLLTECCAAALNWFG